MPSWFIRVEAIKAQLLACNAETAWVPAYVKEKRFQNWLETAHDWAVSRSRFWGTPLPIWTSADGAEVRVIGSVAELEAASGAQARCGASISTAGPRRGRPARRRGGWQVTGSALEMGRVPRSCTGVCPQGRTALASPGVAGLRPGARASGPAAGR